MIVAGPDGKNIDFPDSMDQDAISAAMGKIYPKPEPKTDDSLSGKIGADASKRYHNELDVVGANVSGKESLPLTALRTLGQGGAFASDVAGDLVGEVTPGIVKRGLRDAGEYVAGSKPGQAISGAAANFSKAHPQMAEAIGSVADVAGAKGSIEGITAAPGAISDMVGAAKSIPGKAITGLAKGAEELPQRTSEDVVKESQEAYKFAESKGGTLTPQWTDKALTELNKLRTQTEAGKAIEGDTPLNKLLDRAETLRGKPITLQGAEEVDKALTNEVSTHFKDGNLDAHGQQIMDFQNKFRDMIDNAAEHEVSGGKEGFDALKEARAKWSQAARMRDLEKIMERASDNPKAIKNGMQALYNNKARLAKFRPEEQEAIKKAATTGLGTDILHLLSNKGIAIVHAATGGGIGSSALTYGGNRLAGSAEEALHRRRGQKVIDLVAGRKTAPSVDAALGATHEPLAIEGPREFTTDSQGSTRRTTQAESNKSIKGRERDKELGISPDIRKAINDRLHDAAWNDLTERQQEMVAQQMQKAWDEHKTPIEDVIKAAKDFSESVAAAKGAKPPSGPMSAIYSAKPGR